MPRDRSSWLQTPPEIVPEWYLLPFYAILRAFDFNIGPIDSKLAGVLAMFASIGILFVLPGGTAADGGHRPALTWSEATRIEWGVILLFGGSRFSNMMGDVAKGIKNFKKGMAEDDDKAAEPSRLEAPRPADPAATPTREADRTVQDR